MLHPLGRNVTPNRALETDRNQRASRRQLVASAVVALPLKRSLMWLHDSLVKDSESTI